MASSTRNVPSRKLHALLASLLLCIAITGMLSSCTPGATAVAGTPTPSAQALKTVYIAQGSQLSALQESSGRVRWQKPLDKQQDIPLLAVFNNVLYVGKVNGSQGLIAALKTSDGSTLWQAKVALQNNTSGEILKVMGVVNGVAYAADFGRPLAGLGRGKGAGIHALRASNGSLLWNHTVSDCCSGLAVTDTAVYVSGSYHIDALNTRDGSLLWRHQFEQPDVSLGFVVANGMVYVGTATINYNGPLKGAVDALHASDGMLAWHSKRDIGPLALAADTNNVYIGAFWGHTLEALRTKDGSLLWQYIDKEGGDRGMVAGLLMDDTVYVTSITVGYADNGSTIDAIRKSDGKHLWRYSIAQGNFYDVAGGDKMVYVSTDHGVVALGATDGKQRWLFADNTLPRGLNQVPELAVGP